MPKGIPKSGLNKGWFKKGSHNSIKTEFKKGNVSWIKGKNKFNNDIVNSISEKLTGRRHSEIERKNISKGLKRIGWKSPKGMLGKKHTEEWKRERSKKSKGENNPFYGKTHTEKVKGIISITTKERLKDKTKHPMWLGGLSFEPYSPEFDNNLKNYIRQRNNFTCQMCRNDEGFFKRKLSIHHIDYNKKNNNLFNLISLCVNCHSKTNNNREYWIEYFKSYNLLSVVH